MHGRHVRLRCLPHDGWRDRLRQHPLMRRRLGRAAGRGDRRAALRLGSGGGRGSATTPQPLQGRRAAIVQKQAGARRSPLSSTAAVAARRRRGRRASPLGWRSARTLETRAPRPPCAAAGWSGTASWRERPPRPGSPLVPSTARPITLPAAAGPTATTAATRSIVWIGASRRPCGGRQGRRTRARSAT